MTDSKDEEEAQERQKHLQAVTRKLVILTGTCIFALLVYFYFIIDAAQPQQTYLVIFVFVAGLIGGFVSIQQRLPKIGLGELRELSASWMSIVLIPFNGGIFALVLMLLFLSGIVEGALFPKYGETPPFEYIDLPELVKQYTAWLKTTFPATGPDIAKLLFWSFVAGFSERFVPQIIRKTTDKADGAQLRDASRLWASGKGVVMEPGYTIHKHDHHIGWDNANAPALTVAPGSTVEIETVDSSGGQLSPDSTVADIGALDFGKINPVTGPVFIDGAQPGDALKVTLDGFKPSGWGWTANIPGFGLLADQFEDPALHIWSYDADSLAPALYGKHGSVPLKPFAGTVGLAPAEPGNHSIVPPRRVGGNMDVRDLSAGSVLYLPVEVEGALFSLGDTHAAQGDGEICGTAIESPMDVTLTFDLVKNANLPFPRFTTPGPVSRHLDEKGYEVTTGVGPDLMTGARDAVSGMIDLLTAAHGMAPVDAYMLCSVCGDLRISEIVDQPNWIVSFYFPRIVFE